AGQAHQPDVLGEAGVGEGVQHAAQQGRQAVRADRLGDVLRPDPLADDLTGGEDVTGGLNHRDQHDDDHRDDRGEGEGGDPEVERGGDAEGGGLGDAAEGGVPEQHRHDRADHQAQQHRDRAQEAAEEPLHQHDDPQGAQRVEDVAGGGGALGVVGDVPGGDAQQGDAHGGQHGADHHRREEPQDPREPGRDQEGEQARDDDRAVDHRQALGAALAAGRGQADRDDRAHRGGGHALDDRQAHAHLPEADGLDQGGDAAREQ